MVTLGRELRGYSQTRLAELTRKYTQFDVSSIETGRVEIKEEHVNCFSEILNLKKEFFIQESPLIKRVSKFYYRKRNSLSAKDQDSIESKIKILRLWILNLLSEIEINPVNLPKWSVEKGRSAEEIAKLTRMFFNLDDGPIQDLVSIFETAGIPVIFLNVKSDKFSGMTVQTDTNMSIVFVNKNLPNDHKRFTLCHELGHLIMHIPFTNDPVFATELSDLEDIEEQANKFAGAFLMPANTIKNQFYRPLTYSRLTEFKLYWKVSKQSVIFRAKELGFIDANKFKNLFVELSRNGERKNELIDVDIDEPRLLNEILNAWEVNWFKTKKQICEDLAGVYFEDIQDWLGWPKPLLRKV